MQEEESIGPVIGIVIIVAIIFFGGLFVFFGQSQKAQVPTEANATESAFETTGQATGTNNLLLQR